VGRLRYRPREAGRGARRGLSERLGRKTVARAKQG